jgi:hypothetical protein
MFRHREITDSPVKPFKDKPVMWSTSSAVSVRMSPPYARVSSKYLVRLAASHFTTIVDGSISHSSSTSPESGDLTFSMYALPHSSRWAVTVDQNLSAGVIGFGWVWSIR